MTKQCLSGKYLWNCGVYEGFSQGEEGELLLEGAGKGKHGYFVSRIYDSGEQGMQWDRLVMDIERNAVIRVCVWLFDDRSQGEIPEGLSVKEQYQYLSKCAQYSARYCDMLLYGREECRGRFARLGVVVFPWFGDKPMRFKSFCMSFPKDSFTQYLPRIYRDNLQLERFLAVQEGIYLELERVIDGLAEGLDYRNCTEKQVKRLAGWMGWGGLTELAEPETLRALLGTGISLSSRKGTCTYYTSLVKILTGEDAFVAEEPEQCRATVLMSRKCAPNPRMKELLNWLKKNVPIGIEVRFAFLDRTARLDGMFFLDVTAITSEYEAALLPGGVNIDGIQLM